MSGQISRVIYIWPSWDVKNPNHTKKYIGITYGIGYVPDPKTPDKPKDLCACQVDNSSARITLFYFMIMKT